MCVDPGTRSIGFALSDPEGRVALRRGSIQARTLPSDARAIAELAREEGVDVLVIGLPLRTDGKQGRQESRARELARLVAGLLPGVRVELMDERFSTQAARRLLAGAGVSSRRFKRIKDGAAAAWLLQGYLDAQKGRT